MIANAHHANVHVEIRAETQCATGNVPRVKFARSGVPISSVGCAFLAHSPSLRFLFPKLARRHFALSYEKNDRQ